MDNTTSNQSTLDTLRTVEFRLGLKGYNVDEVDEYLEKAAVEAESLQEQLRAVHERLRQATERVNQLEAAQHAHGSEPREAARPAGAAPAGPSGEAGEDDSLQRTLLLAQKFVEQAKRESEAEAAELVARAEERARTTISQAEERARQLATEADRRLREEVARLETMRTHLADEVEAMTKHLEEQRSRIRTSLTEALKWIDERVQPAPARPQAQERGPDGTAPRIEPQQRNGPAPGERPFTGPQTQMLPTVAPTQAMPAVPPGHSGVVDAQGPADRLHASASARPSVQGSTGDLFDTGAHAG